MSFLKACAEGNLDKVKALLQTDPNNRNKKIRQRNNNGWNCLHRAVEKNQIECVRYLLTLQGLDVATKTSEGDTALQIACSSPNTSREIILMLLQANNELVNYVNSESVDPLQSAIMSNRFDVVLLLIDYGAEVNRQDYEGEAALHIAARSRRVDCIRYLLYETDCDTKTLNKHEKTACFIYFISLLTKAIDFGADPCLTKEELDCFVELVWFTYNAYAEMNANEVNEIFSMMDCCFEFNEVSIHGLYMEIVKIFFLSPTNPRRYFVEKILQAKLPSDYCLITLMFELTEQLIDINFINLRSNFLHELFTLFEVDESFFHEYIAEVMSSGWKFNEQEQVPEFCANLSIETSIQTLFNFTKVLVQFGINFIDLLKQCKIHLSPHLYNHFLLKAFVPLSSFVNAPIELIWNFRLRRISFHHFNESDDFLNDYNRLVDRKPNQCEVVSLKNLSRMSVRKYCFRNYTHYKALSIMYSLNIPNELRNFLCYNCCNLKY